MSSKKIELTATTQQSPNSYAKKLFTAFGTNSQANARQLQLHRQNVLLHSHHHLQRHHRQQLDQQSHLQTVRLPAPQRHQTLRHHPHQRTALIQVRHHLHPRRSHLSPQSPQNRQTHPPELTTLHWQDMNTCALSETTTALYHGPN